MKRFVLVIFLVGFCKVFGSFEFDILGQLTASAGFPITNGNGNSSSKGSIVANFGASLQIGNQYPVNRRLKLDKPMEAPIMNSMSIENQPSPKELKAVSVLLDIKIEQETIALGSSLTEITNINNNSLPKNMYKMTGLNLGAGITTKFIIGSVNSLVPRDTVLGFSLGAKLLVNLFGVDSNILSIPPVITPYLDLFVEQRFFVSRKFALVGGINIGADLMVVLSENNDLYKFLTEQASVMSILPSLNIGVSLGLHFGN